MTADALGEAPSPLPSTPVQGNPSASGDIAARARSVLAGGSTHVARSYSPPIHVVRAQGSRKWLVDGRELVDYTMGHGALILGHAHPTVVRAVQRQAERGTHYGACNPQEVEWAELIRGLVPAAERLRFTGSGTEAVMLALRVARAATGRDAIVKLDDHFHGWYDAVCVNLDDGGRRITGGGVPAATTALTRVVAPGDVDALQRALQGAAALILEGSGAHYGQTPLDAGYLHAAQEACHHAGALLILDEVVTGFRVSTGGIQARTGLTPDLTAFGKIMAGGLPGGGVGGLSGVMDVLGTGNPRTAPVVAHPGTFNANPLTAAAGCATLNALADAEPSTVPTIMLGGSRRDGARR
ncbi:MAG: aspartate aminotransferase family protein [Candidatus Dormibacteria bacterium]